MAYETITSHRGMALDARRNEAYRHALAKVIRPESVVLDLGAGTGVLGLVAARLGAKRVYLVEPSDIISVAEDIVAANGLQGVVRCLHGTLDDVSVPEQVDVIVSVMTGNFLLTEDLLPILFRARDTLLRPSGHLVPDAAVMEAALVSAPQVHETHVAAWSTPQFGVDMSAARVLAANSLIYAPTGLSESTFLCEPAELLAMEFASASYDAVHVQSVFEVTVPGVCHGLAGWFRMRLGDAWLSTSPKAPPLHWAPVFMPIDPPLALEQGQQVAFSLDRQPRGDWSWRLRTGDEVRRHSTMLSLPLNAGTLEKASQEYVPPRTADLAASVCVLGAVDGVRNVTTIAEHLAQSFPARFASMQEALDFTHRTLGHF